MTNPLTTWQGNCPCCHEDTDKGNRRLEDDLYVCPYCFVHCSPEHCTKKAREEIERFDRSKLLDRLPLVKPGWIVIAESLPEGVFRATKYYLCRYDLEQDMYFKEAEYASKKLALVVCDRMNNGK